MENSKIEKVEALDSVKLAEVFINLLEKLGYKNIEKEENSNFITAEENTALKTNTYVFFIICENLSGLNDTEVIDSIKHKLQNYSKAKNSYSFFIISNQYISKGFERKISNKVEGLNIEFKDRDSIIKLIEEHYSDYWKHDDIRLIKYENEFSESIKEEADLKKLKIFNDKYDKVLQIFIEPQLFIIKEDKKIRNQTNLLGKEQMFPIYVVKRSQKLLLEMQEQVNQP